MEKHTLNIQPNSTNIANIKLGKSNVIYLITFFFQYSINKMIQYLNFLSPLYFFLIRPETFPSETINRTFFHFKRFIFIN